MTDHPQNRVPADNAQNRMGDAARMSGPTDEEVAAAVRAVDYKYFGDYEMSEQQLDAVMTLRDAARHMVASRRRAEEAKATILDNVREEIRPEVEYALQLATNTDRPANTGDVSPTPGWMPIETAPKDGTSVLTYPHYAITSWVAAAETVGGRDGWRSDWEDGFEAWSLLRWQPTHWMPLPAPPQP